MKHTDITELPKLPSRAADSNKGSFGRVLVVAGSRGMSGAAVLCGMGAMRGGAGLVQVATSADVQPAVAAANPCYLTASLPVDVQGHLNEDAIETILELGRSANVLAIGPGLGLKGKISEIVENLLVQVTLPVVLDADGLNALSKLPPAVLSRRETPLVMTPHPGEFSRLIHRSIAEVQQNRIDTALTFAAAHRVVLVLKGHGTIVTDGERIYRNDTGNAGMAKGGSGDVLTGLIAALIAQGLAPFEAAQLGVWIHGRAGDLAAKVLGEVAMLPTDLLDYIGRAFLEISNKC